VTEASSITLQTIIDEFKNISPELTSAFIFKKDGEILASNEAITEDQTARVGEAFNDAADKAEVIGGLETLTIQGVGKQLTITSVNNRYLGVVSSRSADEKMVKALTCVIVPTVIKLLDQIDSGLNGDQLSTVANGVKEDEETTQQPEEPTPMEPVPDVPPLTSETVLPKPPVNQFMVEKIGGLLVASDTVRVDADVVAKWRDLYGNKEITQVHVETLEGKAVICKFKPMKEAEVNAKGIVQIPEKILQILRTGEGKLVMVKPVFPAVKEKKR
jgi:predicted regulator of Ras-like GTPase activity (Roadblock/LC7/MglB family)